MNYFRPQPGSKSPELKADFVDGGRFDVHARDGGESALIVFYRGLHCPKCKEQLRELDQKSAEFRKRGISLYAVSMDDKERAAKTKKDWEISDSIRFVSGLDEQTARQWGLYLSKAEFDYEPELFAEPGMYLVNKANEVYAGWIQSTPFARPKADDILAAIDFIREKNYPARGKLAA